MMNTWSTPFEWFGQTESFRPASHLAVLNFAWGAQEFTATQVMAGTGLTRATVIDVLGILVDAGLLTELANARVAGTQGVGAEAAAAGAAASAAAGGAAGGAAGVEGLAAASAYRKGRPARRFAFRPEAGVVVGIDAGYTHLTAIAADLAGNTLAAVHTLTGYAPDTEDEPNEDEAQWRRGALRSLVSEVVQAAGRSEAELFAVCVGVPAPVTEAGNSPRHHSGFWQRVNPGLLEALGDVAPVVRVENDALLAAVAEGSVGAARGCRSYVTVLGGARMGAGVVIDGQLLRGVHGAVGEMNAFEHVRGVGDSRGLADFAASLGAKMVASGQAAAGGAFAGLEPCEVTGRLVFEAIEAQDPDALRIAEKVGQRLARIVTVIESFYDPELIVVSGAVGPAMLKVIEHARAAMPDTFDSIVPELVGSELGAESVVTGAVAAAVQMARANALDIVD
ncbi:ROK family protein [Trueperella pecoris]|uniref:ROK family protein n=1 Tax=Trueperella pecoris TaxID=2733571 RepID=A0A7M1R1P2_9ACTO|nr:ROK family protein [Trueperella pecoris]QOR48086.1 ROK family protein [Trueperella pecoris]